MENTKSLIKSVKRAVVRYDLDHYGWRKDAASIVGCSYQQLSMALTGYRNTPRSKEILKKLLDHIECNKTRSFSQ